MRWHECNLNSWESFLLACGGLLLGFLGCLVLSFLLGLLVLVHGLLVSGLLGGQGFLSLLDFADCLFGEGLLVLRSGVLHFLDVVKGDSLDGPLLSEDFVPLVFATLGLF